MQNNVYKIERSLFLSCIANAANQTPKTKKKKSTLTQIQNRPKDILTRNLNIIQRRALLNLIER